MASLSLHYLQALVAKLGQKEQKPVNAKAFDVLVAPTLVDRVVGQIVFALDEYRPRVTKNVIKVRDYTITVKDRTRFVKFTALNKGGKAEDRFYHHIKDLLKLIPTLDIQFTDGSRKFLVKGVVKITRTGSTGTKENGVGTGKKADFVLTRESGREVPISLKGANGDQLASADSYWRDKARKVIEWALAKGKTTLDSIGPGGYKIDPPIAVEATKEEIAFAAFGTDILPNGCIVKGEMFPHHFALNADRKLATITCLKLYRSVDDFEGMDSVWVQMRNDAGRGSEKSGFWRGIRIVIVKERNLRGALLKVSKSQRAQIGIAA